MRHAHRLLPALVLLTGCPEEIVCTSLEVSPNPVEIPTDVPQTLTLTVTDSVGGPVRLQKEGPITASFADGSTEVDPSQAEGAHAIVVECIDVGVAQVMVFADTEDQSPCAKETVEITCVAPGATTSTTTTTVTEPTVPTGLPPGTHDCMVDADGCLVDDGYGCGLELDEPLTSDSATLTVAGTVEDVVGLSFIEAMLFSFIDPYYGAVYGPGCKVDFDEATVVEDGFTLVNNAALPPATVQRDVVVTCTVDNASGTIHMDTRLSDSQVISVLGEGLTPSSDASVYVGVRGGRVCGIGFEQ